MEQLIKIKEHDGKKAVSARELYSFFGIKSAFTHWTGRMFEYGFEEGLDFMPFLTESSGGRPRKDFALSLDCAKEISMIQRNEKGKQARRYFIEVEKKMREISKPQSTLDILKLTIQGLEEQQKELSEVKEEVRELKAKSVTRPDYLTVAGFGTLNGIPVNLKLASKIGREASRRCKSEGIPLDSIPDPRFGKVKMYPKSVLQEVFSSVQI